MRSGAGSCTPDGPGAQRLAVRRDGAVEARAFGAGAAWLLETLPALLGADDDTWDDWDARVRGGDVPAVVRSAWRSHPGWRMPRTLRVWESLAPTVLEQKVTGQEARFAWRRLVRAHGTPAPAPSTSCLPDSPCPPDPLTWQRIPSWEWHQARVGPERSRTLGVGAPRGPPPSSARWPSPSQTPTRALRSLPGVGVWTSAEVRQRAYGDPDAVSVGDAHVGGQVVYRPHRLHGRRRRPDARAARPLGRPPPTRRPDDRARRRSPAPAAAPATPAWTTAPARRRCACSTSGVMT